MIRSTPLIAFLLASLLGVATSFAAGESPLTLTADNTLIVAGPDADLRFREALIKFLVLPHLQPAATQPSKGEEAKMFPVVRDAALKAVPEEKIILSVGTTRFLTPEDRASLAQNPGETLMQRHGNTVVITGYGAGPAFLNTCAGIRFYAPTGDIWVSRPNKPQIVIDKLDFVRKRYFMTSWFTVPSARDTPWRQMNPASNRLVINANHSIDGFFPPAKYFQTHPEIYEMRAGERRMPSGSAWNPCLSAKALPDITMETIRERMKKDPNAFAAISIATMDCAFDCECAECQASIKKYGGSYSNLLYTYLNNVARQCRKEFPNVLITTLLYSNVHTPPVDMKIEPNIAVKVVTKSYQWGQPERLKAEQDRINTIRSLGAKWWIHDWCFTGVTPRDDTRAYATFLRWGAEHDMLGAYIEWSPGSTWYLDGAKYWIIAQLMDDPYLDVDKLWRTYCDDMYGPGPAGATMLELFHHFTRKQDEAPKYISVGDLPREEPSLYSPEDLALERGLIEKAMNQAKDDPLIQARLAKVMRFYRAHELFARISYPVRVLISDFKGEGINKPLLAYYTTLQGDPLTEAVDYYLNERSQPPDDNTEEIALGGLSSFVNNHTRGKAQLLQAIRGQAIAAVNGSAGAAASPKDRAAAIVARSKEILHENVPEKPVAAQVAEFERGLEKVIAIPTGETAPKIDGDLSDPAWAQAAELTGFTERNTLNDSKHKTLGRVMRVGDKLYFAVTCHQVGPIYVKTTPDVTTGTRVWLESGLEFFFGAYAPGEEKPLYAQYVVNALGAYRGFGVAADNRTGVEAAGKLDAANGVFTVEVALPLKTDKYDYTTTNPLSFTVTRIIMSKAASQPEVLLGWHPLFHTGIVAEYAGWG